MEYPEALTLAMDLISRKSVTPLDEGCLDIIGWRLDKLGFSRRSISPGAALNLYAEIAGRKQNQSGGVLIVGHTDVVEAGSGWVSPPFEPTIRNGRLHGRGASDMKGPIAAFMIALEQLIAKHGGPLYPIGLLLTSDEEQNRHGGTEVAVKSLGNELDRYRYGLVAEPSSDVALLDRTKIGARGKLDLQIDVYGVAGHTGYSVPANESIVVASEVVQAIVGLDFPDEAPWLHPDDTTPHVTNIHSGTGATNAVDGLCTIQVEFRTSPRYPLEVMQELVERGLADKTKRRVVTVRDGAHLFSGGTISKIVKTGKRLFRRAIGLVSLLMGAGSKADDDEHPTESPVHVELTWTEIARPWFAAPGKLSGVVDEAASWIAGVRPVHSISGGTGDARFLQGIVDELIEAGPATANNNIHAPDESLALADLDALVQFYMRVLEKLAFLPE